MRFNEAAFWIRAFALLGAASLMSACPLLYYPFAYFNPCETSENCPSGESCIEGLCWALAEGFCVTTEDCTGELVCYEEFCIERFEGFCETAEDCTEEDYICLDNSCVPPGSTLSCSEQAECPDSFCDLGTGSCAPTGVDWGEVLIVDDSWNNYAVIDEDGINQLDGVNTVAGNLLIGPEAELSPSIFYSIDVATISLPDLRHVTGELWVSGQNDATAVVMSDLKTAGGVRVDENNAIGEISMPALTRVGSPVEAADIAIYANRQLESVDFPALQTARSIDAYNNGEGDGQTFPGPMSFDFGDLETVQSLDLTETYAGIGQFDASNLETAAEDIQLTFTVFDVANPFPALTSVGTGFGLSGGDGATSLTVPLLASAGSVSIRGVQNMATLSMPALVTVTGELDIFNNDALTTLEFPALTEVVTLDVSNNDMYPTCAVDALADQLGLPPADVTNTSNFDDGVCE